MSETTTPLDLFARGRIAALDERTRARLLEREPSDADGSLTSATAAILADVRARGDAALRDLAAKFDRVELDALEVPRRTWDVALAELDTAVRAAFVRAAENIRRFHAAQLPGDIVVDVEDGVRITRTWTPLERVGVYAPGGRAAYPSSVLMGVIPARAAGVQEVVVCSPPGPGGLPAREVLAACAIAGADRLFALGGAGAVAALTYGTESVPAVDALVGPGNRWVTEAKRQVAGRILIDSPAGPSEVLVLADDTADPALIAREILAQAEHDPEAACVLVTTSPEIAAAAEREIACQLAEAPRADVCRQALAACGAILVADTLDEALSFTNAYATEHLSVMTAGALADARRVRTAGTTFVGPSASVAFGDYMTGANHVLPTMGRARSFSGLSTLSYLRSFTVQEVTPEGARSMADDVEVLALAEGLPAHATAARARRAR